MDARSRILDAALVEFARHGYEAASTNTIADAASVAKGLVFHHFGAKDRLYLDVHAHVLARMEAALGNDHDLPADLFVRLHHLALRKLALFQAQPALVAFARTLTGALPDHVRDTVAERHRSAAAAGWARIVHGVDPGSIGEGLTIDTVVDTLSVLGDGLERRMTALLAAGHPPETIAAMAWQHYERVRDGLGPVRQPRDVGTAKPAAAKLANAKRATAKRAAAKRATAGKGSVADGEGASPKGYLKRRASRARG